MWGDHATATFDRVAINAEADAGQEIERARRETVPKRDHNEISQQPNSAESLEPHGAGGQHRAAINPTMFG